MSETIAMASAPCFSPATPSVLVLGLSDSEDEDEATTPRDDSGALQDVVTTASSTASSDSGGSSLEARRAPPRVLKRSLRAELLERWPGWTSPARKRLRAASPDAVAVSAAALSSALARSMASSTPAVGACDRFWQLVERISSQPSLLDEDCEQLCSEEAVDAVMTAASTPPARPASPRPASPKQSLQVAPRSHSPPPSPPPSPRVGARLSPEARRRSSPPPRRKAARQLTAPLSTWVGDDPTLLTVIRVPDDQDDDDDVATFVTAPEDGAESTVTHLGHGVQEPLSEERRTTARDELLERLQLLTLQPPGAAAGATDKAEAEEDSSVLQLLVFTPTEERKFVGVPRRCAVACLHTAAATASKSRVALGALLRLPVFFIVLGIVQVTLYAAPSPYAAQELKNKFVWDKARLFREPWRTMSYAMLHSGQMHVGLNVGVQSFVGAPLEREQSALRVAAVFFGGAIYGALVTGVISPTLHMVGASAGIYAILMSHLAQILLNWDAVRYPKTRAGAVLLLTGADMAYTAHHAIQRGNAAPRIGVTAHCAGALSGVVLGLAFYRTTTASSSAAARARPSYFHCHGVLPSLQLGAGITTAAGVLFCLVWIYFEEPGAGLAL